MKSSSLLAGLLLAATAQAQDVPGITRVGTEGPVRRATLDLDTGEVQLLDGLALTNPGCFANDVDVDPMVEPVCPGPSCLDALLFPAGDELFDWGIKNCGGSGFVESIEIGYASQALDPSQGGPGGSLVLRVYERGLGFGFFGTLIAEIPISGLPSDGTGAGLLNPYMVTIDLGSQSFFLPDGPIGWSYSNTDDLTAPLLVDVTLENGTQNYFDVYRPGPASAGSYLGTFTLPPGGVSNDPWENSFYLVINENDTNAQRTLIPSGGNPGVFSANRPIVGSTWTATVGLNQFPTATGTVVALSSQRLAGTLTPFGTLIADLSTLVIPVSMQAGGTHPFPIPTDSSLVGLQYYAQAAVLSTAQGVVLTNALDLTVGTF